MTLPYAKHLLGSFRIQKISVFEKNFITNVLYTLYSILQVYTANDESHALALICLKMYFMLPGEPTSKVLGKADPGGLS